MQTDSILEMVVDCSKIDVAMAITSSGITFSQEFKNLFVKTISELKVNVPLKVFLCDFKVKYPDGTVRNTIMIPISEIYRDKKFSMRYLYFDGTNLHIITLGVNFDGNILILETKKITDN